MRNVLMSKEDKAYQEGYIAGLRQGASEREALVVDQRKALAEANPKLRWTHDGIEYEVIE